MATIRKHAWHRAAIAGVGLLAATAAHADDAGFGKLGDR